MSTESIAELTSKLKSSPLFNLSLSSKELFHSNFLKWLFDNYADETALVFAKLLNTNDKLKIIKVHRERDNFDLKIETENNGDIAIEVKIKSIASKKQLDDYAKKLNSNDTFLLISLTTPDFFKNNTYTCHPDCKPCYHINLLALIKELQKKIKATPNTYYSYLISDYANFITTLHDMLAALKINWNNDKELLFNRYDIGKLSEIRMHDFSSKHLFNQLSQRIEEIVNAEDTNSRPKSRTAEKDCFITSTVFFRGEGLVDCYKTVYHGEVNGEQFSIDLGVELHGNNLKQFIRISNNSTPSRELKDKLKIASHSLEESNHWFVFPEDEKLRSIKYRDSNKMNQYGEIFLYRYKRIKGDYHPEIIAQLISNLSLAIDQRKSLLVDSLSKSFK